MNSEEEDKVSRNPMPPPHVMDEANKRLKEKMDDQIAAAEVAREPDNDGSVRRARVLNELNLSDEKSRRISSTILSLESERNGYFDYVKDELEESIDWLRNSRIQSISDLDSEDIIARLLIKDEKMSTDTILKVKSCNLDGKDMGYNMDFLLTNKRLILVDNDDDVVNTISGKYSGSFPKSADLKLESRNYFNLLFQPFRLSDITDLNVNFRYGSETRKRLKRGWDTLLLIFIGLASWVVLSGIVSMVMGDAVIGFLLGTIFAPIIPGIMLFFPPKWPIKKHPIFLTQIREINIRIVNEYTKIVNLVSIQVDDNQSIESILDWIETLQSLSSMTGTE